MTIPTTAKDTLVAPPTETPSEELDRVLAAATAAARPLSDLIPRDRAKLLGSVADALDAHVDELVELARRETHLPQARLAGEVARTTFQLRLFAELLEDGGYLEAIIDTADPAYPPGPRPDLRRMRISLGPVLVFAASNFPFAFSVAGGDTAAALAAGCPVIVKAHPGHPALSRRTAEIVGQALAAAPDGTFALVEGLETGRTALLDPRVRAAAFTGSVPAGRALFDLANSRPDPIPFYGELGSLNPVFVTAEAVRSRGARIAAEFVGSFTLGAGQFCTKPGLLFLPGGHGLDADLASAVRESPGAELLNDRIRRGYAHELARLRAAAGVRVLVDGMDEPAGPVAPTLLTATARELRANASSVLRECFGPASIIVEYDDTQDLYAAAEAFDGNLTATVHAEAGDADLIAPLLDRLRDRAGRIVLNGWPTGVAVTAAMQHGGPYPASTASAHTSVGPTAVNRFLRPVSYQSVPQELLPPALRDRNEWAIPRLVGGRMTTEHVTAEEIA